MTKLEKNKIYKFFLQKYSTSFLQECDGIRYYASTPGFLSIRMCLSHNENFNLYCSSRLDIYNNDIFFTAKIKDISVVKGISIITLYNDTIKLCKIIK